MGVRTTLAGITATAGHILSANSMGANISAQLTAAGALLGDCVAALKAIIDTTPLGVVTATVQSGGSGYSAGNVLSLPNGAQVTVATVTSGAVATVSITTPGVAVPGFTALPSNPVAATNVSGTGTGATFNLTWGQADANLSAFNTAIGNLS